MRTRLPTILEFLSIRAAETPGRLAFRHLLNGEVDGSHEVRTWAEVEARVARYGHGLSAALEPGARAVLLFPPGLPFLETFLGCLSAGVIAVPAYPPDPSRLKQTLGHLKVIVSDCGARHILTLGPLRDLALGIAGDAFAGLSWIAMDELPATGGALLRPQGDGPAFLQYTSGSTGDPKGVVLTHHNILDNLRLIQTATGADASTHVVSWLPPYHDMGLMTGLLIHLFMGSTGTLMSPMDFIQRPVRWLRAISAFGATHNGGPDFAFALCARKVSPAAAAQLDLSSWRVAWTGAEPVRPASLAAFNERMRGAGFRPEAFMPCYGLAETTVGVSWEAREQGPSVTRVSQRALERGRAVPGERALVAAGLVGEGFDLRIVDPETLRPVAGDRVGEIWVRGPSVGQGYWGRPDETAAAFGAFLAGGAEGPFLRTGDLGFQRDGRLFVTGRLKDMILVRGRNLYPQDIEATVETAHPALRPGGVAAFAVEDGRQESLVIVVRTRPSPQLEPEAIVAAVRSRVAEVHGVRPATVLLTSDALPKTTSGKIQRRTCAERFSAGEFAVLACDRTEDRASSTRSHDLADWLADALGALLGVPGREIDRHADFRTLGLDSLQAVGLVGELEDHLGRALSPTLVFDQPTVARMAAHLGRPEGAADDLPVAAEVAPVAIVGMGCRYPGGVVDPDGLWRLLESGVDPIIEVPPDRWDVDALYDPEPGTPGRTYARWGGFIDGLADFDPGRFGISPREAVWLDPQHRLLLETTAEAMETSGQIDLEGSSTGVYLGICGNDYQQRAVSAGLSGAHGLLGTAHSAAAGRISYWLGLQGPAVPVDTACSTSLVAVHLACQALRAGDCTRALAGGVNTIVTPTATLSLGDLRALSPTGRCHSFSDDADGYVRSEGCGVVVLKLLTDAIADGDHIHAVIRGSAVNQDGHSNGLTAPSSAAQRRVIEHALASSGLDRSEIDFIEAHGTGTALGDPIEVEALSAAYGSDRSRPLWLSAVKSTLGHTEGAAGITGLIVAALALERGQIPAVRHVRALNPRIDWANEAVAVTRSLTPLPTGVRRAGVSAFGFGGTNAHVLLESRAPARDEQRPDRGTARLLPLSAHSAAALEAHHDALGRDTNTAGLDVGDLAHTLGARRAHQRHRGFVVASAGSPAGDALRQPLRRGSLQGGPPRVGLVFTGQGAQVLGMGRRLSACYPVFRDTLLRCTEVLQPEVDRPLLEVMWGDDPELLASTAFTQPATFAVQVALTTLWRSWGLEPTVVAGHSVGEIAAAWAAGILEFEPAARLAAARGRLMGALPPGGRMVAVAASEEEVAAVLGAGVDLAAVNGPSSVVLSGERVAVDRAMKALASAGHATTPLQVSHAFHSALMEPALDGIEQLALGLTSRPGRLPFVSTLTGAAVEVLDSACWRLQARSPVRFAAALRSMREAGADLFIEVGPSAALLGHIRATLGDVGALASLRRGQPEDNSILDALGSWYLAGGEPRWRGVQAEGRHVPLPPVPFQKSRLWVELAERPSGDALLPAPLPLSTEPGTWVATGAIDTRAHPWLADHVVLDRCVLPGTAVLDLALTAAAIVVGAADLADVQLLEPVVLSEEQTTLQLVAREVTLGALAWELRSRQGRGGWTLHASGRAVPRAEEVKDRVNVDVDQLGGRLPEAVDGPTLYRSLRQAGLSYGPSFQGIERLCAGPGEVLAWVHRPPNTPAVNPGSIQPALLDACLHAIAGLPGGRGAGVPVALRSLRRRGPSGAAVIAHIVERERTRRGGLVDVDVLDSEGRVTLELRGLQLRDLRGGASIDLLVERWESVQLSDPRGAADRWLVSGVGAEALVEALTEWGAAATVAHALTGVHADQVVLMPEAGLGGEALDAIQAISTWEPPPRLWLLTRDATHDPIQAARTGLGRALALEAPALGCRRLDLPATPLHAEADLIAAVLLTDSEERELRLDADGVSASRVVRTTLEGGDIAPTRAPVQLVCDRPGNLDRALLRRRFRRSPGPHEVEVQVAAAGLNFIDVMKALGLYPGLDGGPVELGSECAGIVLRTGSAVQDLRPGQRVVAVTSGSVASHVCVDASYVALLPDSLSFAQGAALPIATMTAWYSLAVVGRVAAGERVLIHSATGGTGLAALDVARYLGAEVLATAGSERRRALLRDELGVEHVFDSRSLDFAQGIAEAVGTVDVVLNSLSGPAIDAGIGCLAPDGRFIELGKTDIYADRPLGLACFKKRLSLVAVDLAGLAVERPERFSALLQEVVDLVGSGALSAPRVETWPVSGAADALRRMARAEHVGKLALLFDDEDRPALGPIATQLRGTVLITGGLGALGLQLARWVAGCGAERVVLAGRSAPGREATQVIGALRSEGVEVHAAQVDVCDRGGMNALLEEVRSGGPLRGVVHAAGVLHDGLLAGIERATLQRVIEPKITGGLLLDELTREDPLDIFVLFGSAAGLLGSPGQGAYSAANAGLAALARARRVQGRPALCVHWGPFAGPGMASGRKVHGLAPMDPEQGLALLGTLLCNPSAPVLGAMHLDGAQLQAWTSATGPRLRGLVDAPPPGDSSLLAAESLEEWTTGLDLLLRQELGAVMHLDPAAVDDDAPLATLGLDSLMAVELGARMQAATGVELPSRVLWGQPSLRTLADALTEAWLRRGLLVDPAGVEPRDDDEEEFVL